jgi:hypothetical protein
MDDENDVRVDMGMIGNDDKGGRESESEASLHVCIYEKMTSGINGRLSKTDNTQE